jgi:uncharacterized protein YggE
MQGRVILASAAVAAVLAATPAVARESHSAKVKVTGAGIVRVHPKNRHSNSSIVQAVQAAEKMAGKRAFRAAFTRARRDAKAAGLVLDGVISISDRGSAGPAGPFGPNRYCGKIRVLAQKPVPGQRPKFKKVRRCFVPRFVFREITVKFSARPAS